MCEKTAHIKCIQYKYTLFEALTNKTDAHWFCPDCNKHLHNYAKSFKRTHQYFNQIKKKFDTLSTEFSECSKAFHDFQTIVKPVSKITNTNMPLSTPPSQGSNLNLIKKVPRTRQGSLYTTPNSSPNVITPPSTKSQITDKNIPIVNLTNATPLVNQNVTRTQTDGGQQATSSSVSRVHPIGALKSKPVTISSLVGVPRRKSIFVSRLAECTTPENVTEYLASKLNISDLSLFRVRKIKTNVKRDISSFIINVPNVEFNTVVNVNFWPVHCVVHEFMDSRTQNNS